jgi:Rod binding domain-containing protein
MDILNNSISTIILNSKNSSLQNNIKNMNADDNKQLRDVCNDFESFFMQQILDVSLKNSKIAGDGTGSDIIKGMYTQSLSQQSSGTLGISNMLYQFLSKEKS